MQTAPAVSGAAPASAPPRDESVNYGAAADFARGAGEGSGRHTTRAPSRGAIGELQLGRRRFRRRSAGALC